MWVLRAVSVAALSLSLSTSVACRSSESPPGLPVQYTPTANWGISWTPAAENPVIVRDPCLSWSCVGTTDPTLLVDPAGTFSIWFTAMGISEPTPGHFEAHGPYTGHGTGSWSGSSIQMALSPAHAPVLDVGPDGAWDKFVETPTVMRVPGSPLLTMWYLGYSSQSTTGGITTFVNPGIGQTTSLDSAGMNWARSNAPIYKPEPAGWDDRVTTGPSVVQGPDGVWRLYYAGVGHSLGGIGLLTSTDRVTWTPNANNPIFKPAAGAWDEAILESTVIYARGQYWLWYTGWSGPLAPATRISIGLATSPDGIHWTRYSGNPVLAPGSGGSWNDLRILAPEVRVLPDGSLIMAAYGQSMTDTDPAQGNGGSIGIWRSR